MPNFLFQNMFLAIINDTYSEVKAEIAAQKNEFEIGDYFKRGYNNVLGKMGARNKYIDIENALKMGANVLPNGLINTNAITLSRNVRTWSSTTLRNHQIASHSARKHWLKFDQSQGTI